MKACFKPSRAFGTVAAPPSKSMGHRHMIAAALAEGESRIENAARSEDILATADCLAALGADIAWKGNTLLVRGFDPLKRQHAAAAHCRESGSTLRFLIPVALLASEEAVFSGAARLFARPMGVYRDLSSEKGFSFTRTGAHIAVKGPLSPGMFTLPGNISSQFVSGLLFALPLLPGESRIRLTGPIESGSYIRMTLAALKHFGIRAYREDERNFRVPGLQRYVPADARVEGDHSNAAFLAALNLLGGDVQVTGLAPDSLQGDRVFPEGFSAMKEGRPFSIADCPDLGPVLLALAACFGGGTLVDTARLRLKESNRGEAMAAELRKLGAAVRVEENAIFVSGSIHPPAVPLFGHNDHRIVMSLSLLLSVLGGEIEGAEAVKKSYPGFFHDLASLHARITLV